MYRWDQNTPRLADGMLSGPLAIFDAEGRTLLISPMTQFMTTSVWHEASPGGLVHWGTMGGVNEIPEGFSVSTIMVYDRGINKVRSHSFNASSLGRMLLKVVSYVLY